MGAFNQDEHGRETMTDSKLADLEIRFNLTRAEAEALFMASRRGDEDEATAAARIKGERAVYRPTYEKT